ncbi:MAG: helix-turn-helix transcriptional regulator [Pseudomonadota bacterium]
MTDTEDFAARFGQLLERYITSLGLTYEEVAHRTWGDISRKGHVSAYIKGKRGKPSAPTIRKFREALGIPAEEIEACRQPPPTLPELDETFRAGLGLGEALMFQLAAQFGHDNPNAGAAAYKSFLEQKAGDYRAMQGRLAKLGEVEAEAGARARLDNQVQAARGALEAGDFAEADEILAAAEEIQQAEHTLKQVRRQAEIRSARGDAALLSGDADTAHTHYAAAAAMFDPFDPLAGVSMRHRLEDRLYEHGLRYGGTGLARSADLLRAALNHVTETDDTEEWARTQNSLAVALHNQGVRTAGEAGAALLAEAAGAYRAALRVRTEAAHPVNWATTQNNLAITLRHQGSRTGGEAGAALLAEAVDAYRAALRVRTETAHPEAWATTQNNLGGALWEQSRHTSGEAGAVFLAEAVGAYRAAQRVYTEAAHPEQWAMTQNNLAIALKEEGSRTGGKAGAALLAEAIDAYRAALRVTTEAAHPVQWAATMENLGLAYEALAAVEPGRAHLEAALAAYDAALTVYDPEHMRLRFDAATEGRERVQAALG